MGAQESRRLLLVPGLDRSEDHRMLLSLTAPRGVATPCGHADHRHPVLDRVEELDEQIVRTREVERAVETTVGQRDVGDLAVLGGCRRIRERRVARGKRLIVVLGRRQAHCLRFKEESHGVDTPRLLGIDRPDMRASIRS